MSWYDNGHTNLPSLSIWSLVATYSYYFNFILHVSSKFTTFSKNLAILFLNNVITAKSENDIIDNANR